MPPLNPVAFEVEVKRAPITVAGAVYVSIRTYDGGEQLFGPCVWTPHYGAGAGGVVLPAVGDRALVIFDDDGTPWVVEWRSAVDPAPGGGAVAETDPIAMPALAAHEVDTTAIHGIANTAALVTTTDARLSDQRVPTDGSVTSAKLGSNLTLAGVTVIPAGTAVAPPLAFLTDTNTGLYSGGADILGFAVGGAGRATISPTELLMWGAIKSSSGSFRTGAADDAVTLALSSGAQAKLKCQGVNLGISSVQPTYGIIESGATYGVKLNIDGSSRVTVGTSRTDITQEAWTLVTFNTGWADYSATYEEVAYFKDSFGIVHLKGVAKRSSGTATLVFTLPVGFRPAKTALVMGHAYDGSVFSAGRADIASTGTVTMILPSTITTAGYFSFESITFRAV